MSRVSRAHSAVTVSDYSRYPPEDTPRSGARVSAPAGAAGSPILPLLVGTGAAIAPVTARVSTGPLAGATDGAGTCFIGVADVPGGPYLLAEGGYDAGSETPAVARSEAELPTGFAAACGISCRQQPAVDDRLFPDPGSAP